MGFGAWAVGSAEVADDFFIEAAKELASYVSDADLESGKIYPAIADLRHISINVATRTAECAYKINLASHAPRPANLRDYIMSLMYEPSYEDIVHGLPEQSSYYHQVSSKAEPEGATICCAAMGA